MTKMRSITKVLVIIFLLCTMVCGLSTSYAAIPKLINYQGRLTDSQGKPLADGKYKITFSIYETEGGGSAIWTEAHDPAQGTGIQIEKGIFNTMIGGVTTGGISLAFDKQYYLGIQVGSDPEMTPRQRLASSAYAFAAGNGVPKGGIIMWSGTIATIPAGWALCDGTNGTPDLREKFIVGARQDDANMAKTNITGSLTQRGGSVTISQGNLPAHTHTPGTLSTNGAGAHAHTFTWTGGGPNTRVYVGGDWGTPQSTATTSSSGDHSHVISGSTGVTGSGDAYTQPYYALAFIMKIE